MRKITCISDWAKDDLAYHEFVTALEGYAKMPRHLSVNRVDSETSTIHTGFLVEQIVYTEERLGVPSERIIFANTDPRSANSASESAKYGAEFMIAKLASGLYVCGPNSGYSLSFIKPKIESISRYVNFETTTVSRSRDLFSRVIAHLADYMEDEMDLEEVHGGTVLDRPMGKCILHVDNFGNVITSITQEEALEKHKFGDYVRVNIGSETHEAKLVTHRFGGMIGEVVMYPGSKGHPDNPYMEIAVWHESTHHKINKKIPFIESSPGDEMHMR